MRTVREGSDMCGLAQAGASGVCGSVDGFGGSRTEDGCCHAGQKGVEFYEAGRFEEALAVFKKMEKKIPTDNQVCLARV